MRRAFLLAGMLMQSTFAMGDPEVCATQPAVVAPCFELRGRLSFFNGAPSARIWPVGTTRMLGIHHDELPTTLASQLRGFDFEAWGTFTVCPLTRQQPGHMQFVCVEHWRDLAMRARPGASASK